MLDSHYQSGEEIRAGDWIELAGVPGRVVFVLETESYSPGFTAENWSYLGRGFMIESASMGLVFQVAADEDLTLVKRV